ncbi:MAG: putative Ig domain-containing protein [Candidatus Rokubacteria bacterium]|nr:putative Ig domain-containing protein [Candidatus Rokubacteria bacterium]
MSRAERAVRWCLRIAAIVMFVATPTVIDAHTHRAPIAHAGDDATVEGGVLVTLDGRLSWDADGNALTYAWTQTEGVAVALDFTDPSRPTFTAVTPGAGGIPAENQVLAFQLTVSNGATTSLPSEVRLMVLKPFDPVADSPAVVRNSKVKDAAGNYPAGSLGFALAYANANPGTRVTFDIPASDPSYNAAGGYWQLPHTGIGSIPVIRHAGLATARAQGTTVDGFSQRVNALAAGVPVVNANGPAISIPGVILEIGRDPAPYPSRIVVRGLAQEMSVWGGDDIVLSGNYYNVRPDGSGSARGTWQHVGYSSGGTTCYRLVLGNGRNIRIGGATSAERNLFGSGCGVLRVGPATAGLLANVLVAGNYFGLDRTGSRTILSSADPSGEVAVHGTAGQVVDARIGNASPASRNAFGGYVGGAGTSLFVTLRNDARHRTIVQGNSFGTDVTGTVAVPSGIGVWFEQQGTTGAPEFVFGGPHPDAGNIVSGNTKGLFVQGSVTTPWRTTIQGNVFGTTADGMAALPNREGIVVSAVNGGGALIGGGGPGEGNVISGNVLAGLSLGSADSGAQQHRILGNLIGVAADGVSAMGNGRDGIVAGHERGRLPIIGGVDEGEGNVIAHNGRWGVFLYFGSPGGTIRGNSIYGNASLGISIDGSTFPLTNDAGDADGGTNERLNYPVLTSATTGGGGTLIAGRLDTRPGLGVILDFYASAFADPTGHGEGEVYLGSHAFTTPPVYAGAVTFSATLPITLAGSPVITATTTDERGNTSEFSRFVVATRVNSGPRVTNPGDQTSAEGASASLQITATDPDADGLSYTATGLPAGLAIVGTTGAITGTLGYEVAGTYAVTVTVIDGKGGTGTTSFTWTVTDVNRAPALSPVAAQTSDEGGSVSLAVSAADDDGDALTYAASGLPPGVSIDPATGAVTGTLGYAAAGTYEVTIEVTDGKGGSASAGFTWTVTNVNRAPTLSAVGDQTVVSGSTLTFTLAATDPDGDAISFGAAGLPAGALLDGTTGVMSWLPSATQVGTYAVTFSATDAGGLASSRPMTITVTAPVARNRAPVCSTARSSASQIWPPNHKAVVAIDVLGVSDPDGDPVGITITHILQDEPTNTLGDGATAIDGFGVGTSRASVRAERSGTPRVPGNGRVYEIHFTRRRSARPGKGCGHRRRHPLRLDRRRRTAGALMRHRLTAPESAHRTVGQSSAVWVVGRTRQLHADPDRRHRWEKRSSGL